MKTIEPSAKLVRGYEDKPEELIELCGRICYDSQDKIAPGTAPKFCEQLRKSGHTSVFEHANFIFKANSDAFFAIEYACRDYENLTALPSYIRRSNLYTYPNLIFANEFNEFYISGNARAWSNLIKVLGDFGGVSLPDQIFESLGNFPALFDIREYREKNHDNSLMGYNLRLLRPSELPDWARERHTTATFLITCDRGISHELVRHRAASFSQQSTRYCKANKNGEIEIIKPSGDDIANVIELVDLMEALRKVDEEYSNVLDLGVKPQAARCILPTCLATKLYMTMTIERWRDFLKLRTASNAHPDMRVIAEQIKKQLFAGEANED